MVQETGCHFNQFNRKGFLHAICAARRSVGNATYIESQCIEVKTLLTCKVQQALVLGLEELVRVERGGQHVGTVKHCRSSLLAAAYGKREFCGALPAWIMQWIADIEQAETSKGVPSAQFWTHVQSMLHGDCILGCNPLVAPLAFTRAYKCLQSQEGWGHAIITAPTCTVYNLLTVSRPEQLCLCRGLTAGAAWYALTRRSALDPQVN